MEIRLVPDKGLRQQERMSSDLTDDHVVRRDGLDAGEGVGVSSDDVIAGGSHDVRDCDILSSGRYFCSCHRRGETGGRTWTCGRVPKGLTR